MILVFCRNPIQYPCDPEMNLKRAGSRRGRLSLCLTVCYYLCGYTVFGAKNTRFGHAFQTARQARHLAVSA